MPLRPLLIPAALLAAMALAGCATTSPDLTTGSLGPSSATRQIGGEAQARALAQQWQPLYDKNPSDPRAALNYGRALRALGQRAQSLAVLQTGAARNSQDMPLLGEYGRALAENGQFAQALDVLSRAHTPDQPNWRVMLAQGAVLDQMGRGPEAVQMYLTALKMVPGQPELLSNLGLSYALQNRLSDGEASLRQACASPRADDRMRQNLALVLVLEGKLDEASRLSGQDLTPDQARQNLETLRGLVGQRNAWSQLKALDAKPVPPASARVAPKAPIRSAQNAPAKPITAAAAKPARGVMPDVQGDEFLLRPSTEPDSRPAAAAPSL